MSDHALFAVAPLVSIVVLVVATTLRTLRASSMRVRQSLSAAPARGVSGTYRLAVIGFLGVLLGHIVMVGWPEQLLTWSRHLIRLMVFELVLVALGVAALGGVCAAIRRGVLRRNATGAGLADAAFLGVLLLTLVSGLGVAVVYRWAAVWSAVTVTRYARSLLSLQPNIEPLEAMPYLVKLHIFSSFIVVALLPFTRLIDVWLPPLLHATGVVMGPFLSTVDRQRRLLQEWVLRSGRSLMWPEEED